MKKILFLLLVSFAICSCSVDVNNPINGQWQLKTIDDNGDMIQVDTVFYSFQSANKFSFRTLENPNGAVYSLGYLDFISDDKIKLSLDTTRDANGNYLNIRGNFLELSGWDSYTQEFTIESIDRQNMVLSRPSSSKIYSFKKF